MKIIFILIILFVVETAQAQRVHGLDCDKVFLDLDEFPALKWNSSLSDVVKLLNKVNKREKYPSRIVKQNDSTVELVYEQFELSFEFIKGKAGDWQITTTNYHDTTSSYGYSTSLFADRKDDSIRYIKHGFVCSDTVALFQYPCLSAEITLELVGPYRDWKKGRWVTYDVLTYEPKKRKKK